MTDWKPDLYTRFEDERTRPARDLLARCSLPDEGRGAYVVDLGCGPGNSTELLAERFVQAARVEGVDRSPAMLQAARRRLPACSFVEGDIGSWTPERPVDLLFTNAALHWVPDHPELLPRLFSLVTPGGLLALQVPDNLETPAQVAMREVASEAPFAELLKGGDPDSDRTPIAPVEDFYDWLAPGAASIEVWHTIYRHPMESAQAITDWFSSTGLKPFVDRLPADAATAYLERYTARIEALYRGQVDGRRLLAFPRLFVVARKA